MLKSIKCNIPCMYLFNKAVWLVKNLVLKQEELIALLQQPSLPKYNHWDLGLGGYKMGYHFSPIRALTVE